MAAQGMPEPSPAKQPSDYRNGDLVSRLLAATPPYLYNMPLLPNSFFFSEMLRSFVQAKSASSASSTGPGQQHTPGRRGRKRTWKDTTKIHHSMLSIHPEIARDQAINDKPLELTTSSRTPPPPQPQASPPPQPPPPPSSLLLPPPQHAPEQFTAPTSAAPPLWYPPSMYHQPPYGTTAPFDPLHFFIDLRVSGHIWDQTKSNREQINNNNHPVEPLDLQTDHDKKIGLNLKTPTSSSSTSVPNLPQAEQMSLFKQSRKHISAFAVPRPRNLTPYGMSSKFSCKDTSKCGTQTLESDRVESWYRCKSPTPNIVGTNYVLQNLLKIYKEVEAKSKNDLDVKIREDNTEDLDVNEEKLQVKDDFTNHGEVDKLEESNVNKNKDDDKPDEASQTEDKKCRDLRALIGLELVKDYVSFEGKRYPRSSLPDLIKNSTSMLTGNTEPSSTEGTLKMEADDAHDTDDDDDESNNIQVDDDDDVDDDDSDDFDNDGVSRSIDDRNMKECYEDYSRPRLSE